MNFTLSFLNILGDFRTFCASKIIVNNSSYIKFWSKIHEEIQLESEISQFTCGHLRNKNDTEIHITYMYMYVCAHM